MACSSSSAGSASSDVSSHENDGNDIKVALSNRMPPSAPDRVSRGLEGILDVASESALLFPLQANRIGTLVAAGSQVAGHGGDADVRSQVLAQAASVRPVAHGSIMQLLNDFIAIKRHRGSTCDLYKYMTCHQLLDRLLRKRPQPYGRKRSIHAARWNY